MRGGGFSSRLLRPDHRCNRGFATAATSPVDPLTFARSLGSVTKAGEVRATHRIGKRSYKKRIRMPSKLDPHLARIETWLAAEPQLTALAIVRRLAEMDAATFNEKQLQRYSVCFGRCEAKRPGWSLPPPQLKQ